MKNEFVVKFQKMKITAIPALISIQFLLSNFLLLGLLLSFHWSVLDPKCWILNQPFMPHQRKWAREDMVNAQNECVLMQWNLTVVTLAPISSIQFFLSHSVFEMFWTQNVGGSTSIFLWLKENLRKFKFLWFHFSFLALLKCFGLKLLDSHSILCAVSLCF